MARVKSKKYNGVYLNHLKNGDNIHGFETFETCDVGLKELFTDFSKKELNGVWELR